MAMDDNAELRKDVLKLRKWAKIKRDRGLDDEEITKLLIKEGFGKDTLDKLFAKSTDELIKTEYQRQTEESLKHATEYSIRRWLAVIFGLFLILLALYLFFKPKLLIQFVPYSP